FLDGRLDVDCVALVTNAPDAVGADAIFLRLLDDAGIPRIAISIFLRKDGDLLRFDLEMLDKVLHDGCRLFLVAVPLGEDIAVGRGFPEQSSAGVSSKEDLLVLHGVRDRDYGRRSTGIADEGENLLFLR